MNKNIPAIILAGGLGLRLRAVDSERPKPMVLVREKPFLYWLVLHLQNAGFTRFIFSTGYKADFIHEYPWSKEFSKSQFSFFEEREALGTGGATRAVFQKYKDIENAWVINGDTLLTNPLPAKTFDDDAHYAALTPSQIFDAAPNLVIENDRLLAVKEGGQLFDGGQVFVTRRAIEDFSNPPPLSLHKLLEKSFAERRVGYSVVAGTCYDIGTPERLKRFEKYLVANLHV